MAQQTSPGEGRRPGNGGMCSPGPPAAPPPPLCGPRARGCLALAADNAHGYSSAAPGLCLQIGLPSRAPQRPMGAGSICWGDRVGAAAPRGPPLPGLGPPPPRACPLEPGGWHLADAGLGHGGRAPRPVRAPPEGRPVWGWGGRGAGLPPSVCEMGTVKVPLKRVWGREQRHVGTGPTSGTQSVLNKGTRQTAREVPGCWARPSGCTPPARPA